MSYNHLNTEERCCLYNLLENGLTYAQIAKALGRSKSTISREVNRNKNSVDGHYNPAKAQEKYLKRRSSCHCPVISDDAVIAYVKGRIEDHWSPQQIAHRKNDDFEKIPSTATIYRMIHDKRIHDITMSNLRRKGNFKRPAEKRGKFNVTADRMIKSRPKSIRKREELGHWEGDTVVSGKNTSRTCLVTLAERKSRIYLAIKVPSREDDIVTEAIVKALEGYGPDLVKTLTFDRGKEFAGYITIEQKLGCKVYFCDPGCAWQKGTNENTNGLLREFYPKGMDLSKVDENELTRNLDLMNNRPRRCLGYMTPNEVFGLAS